MKDKQPAVYIITNQRNGTLYTGVTSDLVNRIYQHKNSVIKGFTSQYGCKTLVYTEYFYDMLSAIAREKQIKGYTRRKKIILIESSNPNWNDIYDNLV
jgi:predicted GIY-YIG superfamily endonuclease